MPIARRRRLGVALDLPPVEAAKVTVERLSGAAGFHKIGSRFVFAGRLGFARTLADSGKRGFLDLKRRDLGNTVAAVTSPLSIFGNFGSRRAR